jgi:hypothetical protein
MPAGLTEYCLAYGTARVAREPRRFTGEGFLQVDIEAG